MHGGHALHATDETACYLQGGPPERVPHSVPRYGYGTVYFKSGGMH